MYSAEDQTTRRGRQREAPEGVWARLYSADGYSEVELVPGEPVLVGRGSECGLRTTDHGVSRRHARIVGGSPSTIEDLDSANGTQVDGSTLPTGKPVPLLPHSLVELGDAFLLVSEHSGTASSKPSGGMDRVEHLIDRVARGSLPVTLVGETGVGKELLAERLHAHSPRASSPFVRINCAALPETLLESELFGHERGAFTGATHPKPGLLETTSGGTLLLDEVGDLPLPIQGKLLRALECREAFRVGSLRPRSFDVRFVAATNRDLLAMVEHAEFRRDLFHRLCGLLVEVPPLRERVDEIEALARGFLAAAAKDLGRPTPRLPPAILAALEAHSWPGNIRELRHTMECAVLLCEGNQLELSHLPAMTTSGNEQQNEAARGLPGEVHALEKRRILDALEQHGGNQTKTAKALGISRRTLISRLEQWGVPRPRKRNGDGRRG